MNRESMTLKRFRSFVRMMLMMLGLLTLIKLLSSLILNLILSGFHERTRQAREESEMWMEALLEEVSMQEGQSTKR